MMSKFLKTLLATTLFAQVAFAQDADKKPEANVKTEQTVSLSPREMLSQAETYKSEVASGVTQIDQMVATAKEKRDVIKLNCLNDKLVEAKANQNVVDKAARDLEQAVAQNKVDDAAHEYSSITIVNQKMQVLLALANECVGEDAGHVGTQQNSTQVGSDVRKDNVTKALPPVVVTNATDPKSTTGVNTDAVRPPPGSPYMP
jgi:hypothetical protein